MNPSRKHLGIPLLGLVVSIPLLACGPWFPNRLLDGGDEAVLVPPYADFFREIERMQLVSSPHLAKPLTNHQTYAEQTEDADLEDLRAALRKAGVGTKERSAIAKRYQAERAKLRPEAKNHEKEGAEPPDPSTEQKSDDSAKAKPQVTVPNGLPGEFVDYFRGAIARSAGDPTGAIAAWRALLERPAKERPFKSTWASFMLGKELMDAEPETACDYFRQVRSLVDEGFADSLGLAAASLGWEAKIHYDRGDYLPATELYLEQAATGDRSAVESLIWISSKLIKNDGPVLEKFARDPKAQRVITAYLLDRHIAGNQPEGYVPDREVTARWLVAVESAGVNDVASAEKLALAAYRFGDVAMARRWLKLAKDSSTAQWLMAKLLLRDGRVDQAAALLARVSREFPLAPSPIDRARNAPFRESLYIDRGDGGTRTASEQVWGELGALRLARREYTEALEALLRSGFWDDAAFVAERVLTLDELKIFVDERWADDPEMQKPGEQEELSESQRVWRLRLARTRESLRHLLARRLTRNSRGSEARAYFPEAILPQYETLIRELDAGYDESKPAGERAQHFMAAARLARRQGMELLGTELEPDFAIYGGGFQGNISPLDRWPVRKALDRSQNPMEVAQVLHASADEQRRTSGESADPPQRFHYRFVASELGWMAAQLLPDNTDEKARILSEAGSWIKYRNPQAADRFYKELVRKCRDTAIGQWADYIRWFPLLDDNGNLRPKQPAPPRCPRTSEPVLEEPSPDANDQSTDGAPVQP